MRDSGTKNKNDFSDKNRLKLQQLRIQEWAASRINAGSSKQKTLEKKETVIELPEKWELTHGIALYPWQKEGIELWISEGKRGTFKIVTGGGKTLLALAAAERLQNAMEPNLRIAIVVPTIVLMNQWHDEFDQRSNIPKNLIGRLGGGYQDSFEDGKIILISVLASASQKLPLMVQGSGIGKQLFLVIDECHRAGAPEMSRVLETERAFVMGLSATPERDDETDDQEANTAYEDTLLGKHLGRVIQELTYEKALKLNLIPPFTIRHYGLPLTPKEQQKYDDLSRSITDARNELQAFAPPDARAGKPFYRWARQAAEKKAGDIGTKAKRFVLDTSRRKSLLYKMDNRQRAVLELIHLEQSRNKDSRILIFHEIIEEAMALFHALGNANIRVLVEHSELPDSIRQSNLELFRLGIANVLVSVKSLIEGFNVPAVDVGIIVASSSSVRQRTQSMGRVMRRHRSATGEEKTSLIYVLYAKKTVDEEIYAKYDWDQLTGIDRNIYYQWTPGKKPVILTGPPRKPLLEDENIDADSLKPGDEYPGGYEGMEYSCDHALNIRDNKGQYITNSGDLAEIIINSKGQPGRFKVTTKKHYVLVLKRKYEDWITIFVTQLKSELMIRAVSESQIIGGDTAVSEWLKSAKAGDKYPFESKSLQQGIWIYKLKRGGVIAKIVKDGEIFARTSERAIDKEKGTDAEILLGHIAELRKRGETVSKLDLNERNHVMYRSAGIHYFIYSLTKGLEFPDL
ncbi:MAG: DEAD/DEAH box helicase [Planctomycetes bacterium]|nr:DEAD/DEAH box helicase [Planctomycetota bacterium]